MIKNLFKELCKEVVKRAIAGIMLYCLFSNMSIVIKIPITLDYLMISCLAVAFNWELSSLAGATVISTLLRIIL